ncbi:YvrJ family protein, partial [Syntrophomonas zehnderi]
MNELLSLIGNVGFPIAVSIYLLIRVENKLGDLAWAIGELREAIITLPHDKYWPKAHSQSSYP